MADNLLDDTPDEPVFTDAELDAAAIRTMFAAELRAIGCNGLAVKVENGSDTNPRTHAALNLARKLAGVPIPDDEPQIFIRSRFS